MIELWNGVSSKLQQFGGSKMENNGNYKWYRIVRYKNYEYEILEVWIWEGNINRWNVDSDVRFIWQADQHTDYWYGATMEVRTRDYETLEKVARIIKKLKLNFYTTPEQVLTVLQKQGYKEVVYIGKLGYVPAEEFTQESMTIYKAYLGHNDIRYVLAENEDEAQRKFQKMAFSEIERKYRVDEWAEWLKSQYCEKDSEVGREEVVTSIELKKAEIGAA